jgi:hypothetical protein
MCLHLLQIKFEKFPTFKIYIIMKKNHFLTTTLLFVSVVFFNLQANVVDVTHYIANSNFEGDPDAWTVSRAGYSSFKQQDGSFEAFNADNASSWFNQHQEVSIPAGVYRMTANAFHRGYHAEISNVVLYGSTTQKEFSVGIKTLSSESESYGSSPATMAEAKTAFNAGYWLNTLNDIIVEDEGEGMGTLRVGMRNISQPLRATSASAGNIWTVWSNFKLYQISGSELDPMRDKTVAAANALLAEATNYNDGGTLAASIAVLSGISDADLTLSAVKNLQNDMLTYRSNRISSATTAKPADVTHLIKNASFELGHVSKLGTANGHYNEPIGWVLNYTASTHTNNNISVIDNKVIAAGAGGVPINPTHGDRLFSARYRWTSGQSFTISQEVDNLPTGKYRISADLGKFTTAGTAQFNVTVAGVSVMNQIAAFKTGPAFTNVSAVFDALAGDKMVVSAYMVQSGANEATIMLDNIKLEYLGVEPFLNVNQTALNFTPGVRQKMINIKGGNLVNDITLTPSANFTLSATSITAAEAMTPGGVDITVSCSAAIEITDGSLTINSATLEQVVALTLQETAITVSHAGFLFDQTFSPEATLTVSGDLFAPVNLSAPSGVVLSQTSISTEEALAGKEITLSWDKITALDDRAVVLNSGGKSATVNIYAVLDNMIADWDGDAAEGDGSKLTDFGWTLNNTAGEDIAASFTNYNATSGIRYVPMSSQAYTYRGGIWSGHRMAYLRTWGADASNTFNLAVNLEANVEYVFRAVAAWHNNEVNPSFTFAVKNAKGAGAEVLASQTNEFTVRRIGADYKLNVTPTADAVHYITFSSSQPNDALAGVMYMAISPKKLNTAVDNSTASAISVYSTADGSVRVNTPEKSTIRLFDLSGRLVMNIVGSGTVERFELPSAGIFLLEVNSGVERKTMKVLRLR